MSSYPSLELDPVHVALTDCVETLRWVRRHVAGHGITARLDAVADRGETVLAGMDPVRRID